MRHATVLAALVLIFSADIAFAESDLTQELKAAAKLPPLEEMKAAANDAWANYHKGKTNHQLSDLLKAQKEDLRLLSDALSSDQKTKYSDVLERAKKYAETILPAGQRCIDDLNVHALALWGIGLLKGKPAFTAKTIDYADKTISNLEEDDEIWDCVYYGWDLEKCKKYVDDDHQQWLSYDSRLKDLVLELVKREPEKAKQWTKVGDDLSLDSFRTGQRLIEDRLAEAKAVSRSLLDYAKAKNLIETGETVSTK